MKKIFMSFLGAAADNGKGGEFGVDEDGWLSRNGKPVVTEKR